MGEIGVFYVLFVIQYELTTSKSNCARGLGVEKHWCKALSYSIGCSTGRYSCVGLVDIVADDWLV